jgi:hypothetical protein
MKEKTAVEVNRITSGVGAKQRLYRLSSPMTYEKYDHETGIYRTFETDFVLVSAVNSSDHGPETYIFPADRGGNVLSWTELDGSFIGSLDHIKALKNAGYAVTKK